jgi:hypothetical protein
MFAIAMFTNELYFPAPVPVFGDPNNPHILPTPITPPAHGRMFSPQQVSSRPREELPAQERLVIPLRIYRSPPCSCRHSGEPAF